MDPRDLIPLVAVILIFGIPIIAILTSHQQKMAKLIHGSQNENKVNGAILQELQSMRAEMAHMREVVNEQALVIDDLRSLPRTNVAERLNQEN